MIKGWLSINCDAGTSIRTRNRLRVHPCVQQADFVSGPCDVMAIYFAKTMEASVRYFNEISDMEGVRSILGQLVLPSDLELIEVPTGVVPYE